MGLFFFCFAKFTSSFMKQRTVYLKEDYIMEFVLAMILLLIVGFLGCVLLALCALAIHEGPDLIWKVRKYVHMRRNTITLKKGQYRIED